MSSSNHRVQYFLLKLRTCFLLTNVNRVFGIFLILFRSWVICKNKKRPGLYTLVFCIFVNNSITKQKKSQTPFCSNYWVGNVCKISAKNIKLCGSWSSSKFSIFQTGFSEIIELCLNLGIEFCITWLVLLNCKKTLHKS